jgi:hypothetical protein
MKNCDSMTVASRCVAFNARVTDARAASTRASRRRASRETIFMSAARSEAPTSTRATTNATTTVQDANDGVSAAFALTLSVVSSVSLVIVNKHLISVLGFREGASRATREGAREAGGRPLASGRVSGVLDFWKFRETRGD